LVGSLKSTFLCLVLITPLSAQRTNAEQLHSFGLSSLQPITDEEGRSVRGLGLLARQQGFSLVSGTLFDPATGSTLRERAVQYTQVVTNDANDCCTVPEIDSVFATTARDISIQEELTIQAMNWTMSGSIITTGYSYAERF
jgi:hypothetical protein